QVQVAVEGADEEGRREVAIYSRPDGEPEAVWARHASGVLSSGGAVEGGALTEWPTPGGEAVSEEGDYDRLAETGLTYGPVFQGLRSVWRDGSEVFAEVELPEGQDASGFGLHPALLDAALHGLAVSGVLPGSEDVRLPFAWSGFRLFAVGA